MENIYDEYNKLLDTSRIKGEGITIAISAPWSNRVEINIVASGQTGIGGDMTAGFSETRAFINLDDVDEVIRRLQVARDFCIQKQKDAEKEKKTMNMGIGPIGEPGEEWVMH